PGLAIPELAPDWAAYMKSRSRALVRILGSYPVTWRTKFTNMTFSREPENLSATQFREFKLVKDLQRKNFKNIVSPAVRASIEVIATSVGLSEKGKVEEALARQLAGQTAKRSDVEKKLAVAAEELQHRYPQFRRVQVFRTKVGPFAKIQPSDGPARKVEITTPSEGIVVWQQRNGKSLRTQVSLLRPRPLQPFGYPRIDPPVPPDATVLGQLHRHEMIWLKGEPDRPEGFYRVTKCQASGISLQSEEAVPAEILRRIGIKLDNKTSDEASEDEAERVDFTFGKQALAEYFSDKKKPNGRPAGRERSE
ncbi:MAG: hypothetical protein WBE20_09445, partial [Candidatus Acidiferrales bacterium]